MAPRREHLKRLVHGGQSQHLVSLKATAAKRRMLRNLGIHHADLDPMGRALLDLYARSIAKVMICDEYFDLVGIMDESGEPRPILGHYFTAMNSASRTLARLEAHLQVTIESPIGVLAAAGKRVRLAAVGDG